MNIPENCPAFGALLLLSDQISIIAPDRAPIVEGFKNNPKLGVRFLEEEKRALFVDCQSEITELSKEISNRARAKAIRVSLGVVVPTVISMALSDDAFHSAAYVGLSGITS